jgi:plastocyanin
MDRRTFLAVAGAGTTLGLAGCVEALPFDDGNAHGDGTVTMSIDSFRPEEITVEVGTTVTWKNTSGHGHTVTAYEGGIPDDATYWASGGFEDESAARDGWEADNSGVFYQGESYEHTFEVVGTHQYFCIPHEDSGMLGFVHVEPAETEPDGDNETAADGANGTASGADR